MEWSRIWNIEPIAFHPALLGFCEEAVREVAGSAHRLPSGPLHDAAEVARSGIPAVMMFVQSLRGISHNKIEDTTRRAPGDGGAGSRQAGYESGALDLTMKPSQTPKNPCFSSGPCAKRPGWSLDALKDAALGRSHRAKIGKNKLAEVIERSKKDTGHSRRLRARHRSRLRHRRGGDGAVVVARRTGRGRPGLGKLQQRLGHRLQDPAAAERSSRLQSRLRQASRSQSSGLVPRCASSPGTEPHPACGFPNGDWIAADRAGLSICDATSAVFAMEIPWDKLDVVTWSWQKVLGGEGAHGMIALSPRAVAAAGNLHAGSPLAENFSDDQER